MLPVKPLEIKNQLHGNPTASPQWALKVKNAAGKEVEVSDPLAVRAMIALMDMGAVQGGAACHFGGPSAFAEIMSSLFGFMFSKAQEKGKQWCELFNFINDAGHCENGLYALRANYRIAGLSLESLRKFRSIESVLSGHGEAHLFPEGVQISNGPLGSGLPQAQGLATAEVYSSSPRMTITTISDGGCMEGEARESMAAIPGLAAAGRMGPFALFLSDNNTKLSGRIDKDSFSMAPTFTAMEALGWHVIKVEDGHDLQKCFNAVEQTYELLASNPKKPVFVWFKTVKGRGIKKTEESASGGHGFPLKKADELGEFLAEMYGAKDLPGPFKAWMNDLIANEKPVAAASTSATPVAKKVKIQDGVAKAFIEAVEKNKYPVLSVSADLQGSTGMEAFRKKFPELSIEVGVAESNMVSVGIGLSVQGYIPVVDTFAQFGVTKGALPFTMSGLSEGPMIGIFSHTGFQDAADGASHQALSYVAMLSSIPNVDTYCLSCSDEAYHLVGQAVEKFAQDRAAGKVPRTSIFFLGRETFPASFSDKVTYKLGKAQVISEKWSDRNVVLVPSGSLVSYALKAQEILNAKGIGSVVVNASIMNSPDMETLRPLIEKAQGHVLTLEDHRDVGGMASYLAQAILEEGIAMKKFTVLGVKDHFGRSAYQADQLYKTNQMDDTAIVAAVQKMF